jgi:hypothetical protein
MKNRNEKRVFEKTAVKEKRVRLYKRLALDDSKASMDKVNAILENLIMSDTNHMLSILVEAYEKG